MTPAPTGIREFGRIYRVMGPILWCAQCLDGPIIGFSACQKFTSKVGCLCCPFEHAFITVMIYEHLLTHFLTLLIKVVSAVYYCFILVLIWLTQCLSTKFASGVHANFAAGLQIVWQRCAFHSIKQTLSSKFISSMLSLHMIHFF
jgi:hypothetical protein